MSWLGNIFSGSQASSTSTSTTSDTSTGTFAGVGQTTPSTLPYTVPTTHIGSMPVVSGTTHVSHIGTATVTNGGYVSVPIGGIGGISSGGIYNSNQIYTTNSTGIPNYGTVHISGPTPSISTDKGKIDLNELGELISVMKERLLIITPNFEKHEKYAALKKAYDHYKLLEAMLSGDENDNK